MSMLDIKNLSTGYGKTQIIDDISLAVDEGEICGIIGSNGSGKTTLIKAICNTLPHEGTCSINNNITDHMSAKEMARLCSYIPQQSGISIDLSVLDVVLMGFNPYLSLLQNPSAKMVQKAREVIAKVGLSDRTDTNYLLLSQGQKQLCLLARSIVADSLVLLMDEPESALDFSVRYSMMETICDYVHDKNGCALIAIHDINLALNYCDKLFLIKDKKLIGTVIPRQDSLSDINDKLSLIYGAISIHEFTDKSGANRLIMMREPEV